MSYNGKPLIIMSRPWYRHYKLPWGWYSVKDDKIKDKNVEIDGLFKPDPPRRERLLAVEGYKVKREISDKGSYTSNMELRFKMKVTKNPVTRSSYRQIRINRADTAIKNQPYYGNKAAQYLFKQTRPC